MECDDEQRAPWAADGREGDGGGVPLPLAPTGRDLRVVRLAAGRELARRLASMCIGVGSTLRVVPAPRGGPLMVAREDARYAIGRGAAMRIMVVEV